MDEEVEHIREWKLKYLSLSTFISMKVGNNGRNKIMKSIEDIYFPSLKHIETADNEI